MQNGWQSDKKKVLTTGIKIVPYYVTIALLVKTWKRPVSPLTSEVSIMTSLWFQCPIVSRVDPKTWIVAWLLKKGTDTRVYNKIGEHYNVECWIQRALLLVLNATIDDVIVLSIPNKYKENLQD